MSKAVFDRLRQMSGGSLTTAQVNAGNQAISRASEKVILEMLGVSMSRATGQRGIDLIKRFEGLRLRSYLCPANVWTIGYGHTGNVTSNQIITSEQAESILKSDLQRFENAVSDAVKVPLNQNQFDALVSLAFNIGVGAFSGSTLVRMLNAANYTGAADQFLRWNRAGGRVLDGLTRRRQAERALFLS